MMNVPADLKAVQPFIRRAEELDLDSRSETKVVAYYCRQYAMEVGISLKEEATDQGAVQGFLISLIERLEKDKDPNLSKDEGEQVVFKFASDVFARADAEDRAGNATKSTARTFYAASVFFDCLKQFGDRGHEADEKCRYAKWKATDILKAIKEGRRPSPGGPADEAEEPAEPKASRDDEESPPPVYEDVLPGPAPASQVPPPVVVPAPEKTVRAVPTAPPQKLRHADSTLGEAQLADALEYAKFAVAALEAKDIGLAVDRLRGALGSLGV